MKLLLIALYVASITTTIVFVVDRTSVELRKLDTWNKNIEKARSFIDQQSRMNDSVKKYYLTDYRKTMFYKDSHDYYYYKAMAHVYKTD